MTTYTTAQEAIDRSISHNEIAYCEDTPENREYLSLESDGDVDTGDDMQYWADDPDGNAYHGDMLWRVHILTPRNDD